jgi:6-phosphofructokinase 1
MTPRRRSRPARTLVVGQSGGATAVINATLAGVVTGARASGRFDRVLGMRHGSRGLLEGEFVDLTGLPPGHLDALARTPSAALGTSRLKLDDRQIGIALHRLDEAGCRALVLIGGNDSADTALRLSEADAGLDVVLAPKTVDNDLPGTDHCPGYPSAARCLATLIRDATWDSIAAPELYPVKFIDVMGRDAGWLAAAAGLGFSEAEADLRPVILLPERPPESLETLLAEVEQTVARRGFAVYVVPETLRDAAGLHLSGGSPGYVDPFGHPYAMPPAVTLAAETTARLGLRARFERPGSAVRMAMALASPLDLQEAFACGEEAARALAAGERGVMIAIERHASPLYAPTLGRAWLVEVANRARPLDADFIAPDGRDTTAAFRDYALPLLGPEPFLPYARL